MAKPQAKKAPPESQEEKLLTGKSEAPAGEKPKRKVGTRGSTKFADTHVITLLVDYNPKRAGSASHGRFEKYEDGLTVEDAQKAGITAGDLLWDTKHGFIEIGAEYNDKAVVKSKPAPAPKKEKPGGGKAPAKKGAAKKVADEDEEEEEE